jgi:signal transduction histidine kinase
MSCKSIQTAAGLGNLRSLEQVFNNLITNAVQAAGVLRDIKHQMLPAPQ